MGEKVLTVSEVLEIVYNSDESLRDRSSDSVNCSEIEIDDIDVADAKQQLYIRTFRNLVWSLIYAVY